MNVTIAILNPYRLPSNTLPLRLINKSLRWHYCSFTLDEPFSSHAGGFYQIISASIHQTV